MLDDDDTGFGALLWNALGPSSRYLDPPDPAAVRAAPELPESLRRFYAQHNGQAGRNERDGALHGLHVLRVPKAPKAPGFISRRCISVPYGAVIEAPLERWVFAGDIFSGDGFLFVDTRPGPAGRVGQVVALDLLGNRLVVLGEDFEAFLQLLAKLRLDFPDAADKSHLIANLGLLPHLRGEVPEDASLRPDREWVAELGPPWSAALMPYVDAIRGTGFGLDHVRRLNLDRDKPVDSLAALAQLPDLRSLQCRAAPELDLGPLAEARRLKVLELQGPGPLDIRPLTACRDLVELRLGAVRELHPLAELPALRMLQIGGRVDLEALAECCPKLEELDLRDAELVHPEARDRFEALETFVEPRPQPEPEPEPEPEARDDEPPRHRWRQAHSWGDPDLDLEEQLERGAFELLVGLVADGDLLTASSHGPRTLAVRAGRRMAKHPDAHSRAAALAEWLLEEDEVEDLLIDDDSLAARIAVVFPDPDPDPDPAPGETED